MSSTVKYILLSLIFAIVGFLLYGFFFAQSMSQIKSENIVFTSNSITSQFTGLWVFTFAVGIVPLLHLVVSRIAKIRSTSQSLLVYCVIILAGIFFWQLRIKYLISSFNSFNETLADFGVFNSANMSELRFSMFLLIGFVTGAVLSSVMVHLYNRQKPKNLNN